jgi:hypothetical protein
MDQQFINLLGHHGTVRQGRNNGVLQRDRKRFPVLRVPPVELADGGAEPGQAIEPFVQKPHVKIHVVFLQITGKQRFRKICLIIEVPVQQIIADNLGDGGKIAAFHGFPSSLPLPVHPHYTRISGICLLFFNFHSIRAQCGFLPFSIESTV